MYRRSNNILGRPVRFCDPDQIAWHKRNCAIMDGEYPVGNADWEPVIDLNRTTETGKPLTKYCFGDGTPDAVQIYVECPRCGRLHKHVVAYDFHTLLQTEEWAAIDETPIVCWNCKLEMYISDDGSRNIYVKKQEE